MKQRSLVPSATERDSLDFNRTPAWVVQLLVPELGQPRTILDVGCGDGAIGRVLRQAWPAPRMLGIELDVRRSGEAWKTEAYTEVLMGDWLDETSRSYAYFGCKPDLIISNPPFGLPALRFLELALQRVAKGGTVAFLLPVHWDCDPDVSEGFARQRFLDALRLPDGREGYAKLQIVGGGTLNGQTVPARPSFKKGGTASDRYAWFMFGEGWAGAPSRRLHAIPPATTGQLALLPEPAKPVGACLPYAPGKLPAGYPEPIWNPRSLDWE